MKTEVHRKVYSCDHDHPCVWSWRGFRDIQRACYNSITETPCKRKYNFVKTAHSIQHNKPFLSFASRHPLYLETILSTKGTQVIEMFMIPAATIRAGMCVSGYWLQLFLDSVCRGLVTIEMDTKVQYLVHNSPSLISIFCQMTPVHTLPSYFKIHSDIIFPFASTYVQWCTGVWRF